MESWIFIIDSNNMGVFGLPLKTLKYLIDMMALNYHTRLERMYIINPSNVLEVTWGAIQILID